MAPSAAPAFYKFREYNAGKPKEFGWVRDTLFANRIRFAHAWELNDPFEGRPHLVPQFRDPKKQRAAIYEAVLSDAYREGLTGDAAIQQATFETSVMLRPGTPHQAYQNALIESIHENFLVYCVCATRDPLLMWSHYADGHKGIALHFDPQIVPFRSVYEVHYTGRYPKYPFPAAVGGVAEEAAKAMLYTKSAYWRYEKEHRAIRVTAEGSDQDRLVRSMGLKWDGEIVTLPDKALIGVTLGAAIPSEVARELTADIAKQRPSLEVWQAATGAKTYRLDFHRVR